MKKLLIFIMCIVYCFSFIGCNSKSDLNNTTSEKAEDVKTEEKMIEYISGNTFEKGVCSGDFYYNRWLNLFFHSTYFGLKNNSQINDLTNAVPYDSIEMKFHSGQHETEVGVFLKNCGKKSKEELIEENKKKLTSTLENSYKVMDFEWKDDEKITLCNEEYDLLKCKIRIDIIDEKYDLMGQVVTDIWCTFYRLCRIVDDKFVTIQVVETEERGFSDEVNFKTTLSGFEEISSFDIVKFGHYDQDNNEANGKEKIEWYVIKKEDNKALLISKYGLDLHELHENSEEITWENCSLNKWLNNEFINTAFCEEEQEKILTSTISNDFINYNSEQSAENQNKIFLLSLKEAETYFKSAKDAVCAPTKSAYLFKADYHPQIYNTENFGWWVRTPSERSDQLYEILHWYYYYSVDDDVVTKKYAIRPVLWLNIE